MFLLVLLEINCLSFVNVEGQANTLGGALDFKCESGAALAFIESTFYPPVENNDRIWDFGCISLSSVWDRCFNTRFSRAGTPQIGLQCEGGILTGVRSTYDPYYTDRSWSFQCCYSDELITTNCRSLLITDIHRSFFRSDFPRIINGMGGYYSEYFSDRRWVISTCDVVPRRSLALRPAPGLFPTFGRRKRKNCYY